jgi:hypothetical protein
MKTMRKYKEKLRAKGLRDRDVPITLVDLADAAGFHYASVYRIYNGTTKNPQADTMDKLAMAFGLLMKGK